LSIREIFVCFFDVIPIGCQKKNKGDLE